VKYSALGIPLYFTLVKKLSINSCYVLHSAVDCGQPPILMDSVPIMRASQRTTYGVQVAYRCVEGRWFARYRYTEVATCTASARWEAGGETELSKMPACIRKYSIAVTVTITNNQTVVTNAMVECEKIFRNYFSFPRRPLEIISFQLVETCPKLFQNYSRRLLLLMNSFQHVQCR